MHRTCRQQWRRCASGNKVSTWGADDWVAARAGPAWPWAVWSSGWPHVDGTRRPTNWPPGWKPGSTFMGTVGGAVVVAVLLTLLL